MEPRKIPTALALRKVRSGESVKYPVGQAYGKKE